VLSGRRRGPGLRGERIPWVRGLSDPKVLKSVTVVMVLARRSFRLPSEKNG